MRIPASRGVLFLGAMGWVLGIPSPQDDCRHRRSDTPDFTYIYPYPYFYLYIFSYPYPCPYPYPYSYPRTMFSLGFLILSHMLHRFPYVFPICFLTFPYMFLRCPSISLCFLGLPCAFLMLPYIFLGPFHTGTRRCL